MMKIARIVFATTLLLSLKSTLFCSSEESNTIQAPRKESFDALRDGGAFNGWLGWNADARANYTLENNGDDYKNSGKQVRIGSKDIATVEWTAFGQRITTLPKAQQFMKALHTSGVQLPEQATLASKALIDAENQRIDILKLAALKTIADEKQAKLAQIQERKDSGTSLLQAYHTRIANKSSEETRIREESQARFEADCKAKLEELHESLANEKKLLTERLRQNATSIKTIEESLNIESDVVLVEKEESKTKEKK